MADVQQREALNDYLRGSIVLAWAEWFRGSRNIANPETMGPAADDKDRAALERNAPTVAAYLVTIKRAIDLVLEEHPRALAEGRDVHEAVILPRK